jgi:hypothetical protein
VLKVKLEDWVLAACHKSQIDITKFSLPGKPNDLHDVINNRLQYFEKLLDALLKADSPPILQLVTWLQMQ